MSDGSPPSEGSSRRTGPPAPRPPSRGLDRDELDRVIRRATELQFAGSDSEGGRMSEDEVIRIGREVGLAPEHVRRALGELRAESLLPTPPRESGVGTRLFGPARVGASRVVPGTAPEVARALEEYLRVGESLRQVRKRGLHSRWEPEQGIVAGLQRSLGWGGRTYELARTKELEVRVEALEDGFSLVALEADLSSVRAEVGWGWGLGLGTGGAGLGFGLGMAVGFPLAAVPLAAVGAGAGIGFGRRDFAGKVDRVRTAMEGILDRLEAREALLDSAPSIRDRLNPGVASVRGRKR
jgi:hypothetical protein